MYKPSKRYPNSDSESNEDERNEQNVNRIQDVLGFLENLILQRT